MTENTVYVLLGGIDYGDNELIGVYAERASAESAKEKLENSDVAEGTIPTEKTALPEDHDWDENLYFESGGRDHPRVYDRYHISEQTVR